MDKATIEAIEDAITEAIENYITAEQLRQAIIDGVLNTMNYDDAGNWINRVFREYK